MAENNGQMAIQDIYNMLTEVRSHQAKTDQQLNRVRNAIQMDAKEMAVGAIQNNRETMHAVGSLTKQVERLVDAKEHEGDPDDGQNIHLCLKHDREKEVRDNLARIQLLSKCRQEKTAVCPCGKHHGLCFKGPDGAIIEQNMCPKVWWIKQSRLAFEKHHLSDFVNSMPLETYVGAYTIIKSSVKGT